MSIFIHQKKLQRILVGFLVCAMVMTGSAFSSPRQAEAATKAPAISSTTKDLLVGGEVNLSIKNQVNNSTSEWKSSNKSIASVDQRGKVKGLKKGKVTITCTVKTTQKTYNLKCNVNVRIPAKSVKISNAIAELKVGDTYNLNRTITPSTSNDITSWSSSDKSIANPNKNGEFKALKEGTVTITAKTLSGKKDSVKIKVVPALNTKTLNKSDVKNGMIKLTNANYDILTIDSNVGEVEIILENVKIKDTLAMETDAKYTVRAINCEIANVVSLEEKQEIASLAVNDKQAVAAPTFIAEKGTLVVTVDARGNVSVKQEGEAKIGVVTVNRTINGNISLNLEGFEGNLVINTTSVADIDIVTKDCSIEETTVTGTSTGQRLTLADDTAGGHASSLGRINVETNAKLKIDVPATELVISQKISDANVIIEKPVEKIVNEGSATQLTVNSNVSSVVSKGDKLTMKVAAGSTVKGVELSGNKSVIDVALGSKIDDIVAKGNDASIIGSGKVVGVKIEGNNSRVNTADTKVSVDKNASGTTMNGKDVKGGETVNSVPIQPPSPPYVPVTPTNPDTPTDPEIPTDPTVPPAATGSAITIADPGRIIAGTPVQLTADSTDVTWLVYSYIDNTWGYAQISESGMLTPKETGVVRVVVLSNKTSANYGAVDITIYGKKFVRVEPIAPIELTVDEGLFSLTELANSGKLPTKVNLVYETGNGAETEVIEAPIYEGSSWSGTYEGKQTGSYMVRCYIPAPDGCERPNDLYACVEVKVKVPQSGQSLYVKSIEPLNAITLTTDENCLKVGDLMNKYYQHKKVLIHLSDNSTKEVEISGYFTDSGNQYNGAVKGTYIVNMHVPLPLGILYKHVNGNNSTYINWYYDRSLSIPATIVVAATQTGEVAEDPKIPATTQPKLVSAVTPAAIQAVELTGVPSSWNTGDTIDLTQYLTVKTDSALASDRRVIWSYNGYSWEDILDSINGKIILNRNGSAKIRATSVIDKTKYCEVIVPLANTKQITSFDPIAPITVNTDRKIYNFKAMYKALEDQLPKTITGTTNTNEKIEITITGFNMNSFENGIMVLYPSISTPYGYTYPTVPSITINITVPQTDDRVVVASAMTPPTITLSEDKYATTSFYTMKALYQYDGSDDTVSIRVKLQDGTEKDLQCRISGFYISDSKDVILYKGKSGTYKLEYQIILPDGYKVMNPSSYYDLRITQELIVTRDQSPRYERLFVASDPTKLNYKVGELLDLSGLMVMFKDTTQNETDSYTYIGLDKLKDKGLELHWEYESGPTVNLSEPIPSSMKDRTIYIYVTNPSNYSSTFLGPITITE